MSYKQSMESKFYLTERRDFPLTCQIKYNQQLMVPLYVITMDSYFHLSAVSKYWNYYLIDLL